MGHIIRNVGEKSLLQHCEAVEKAMRAYAEKYGEDVEYWGQLVFYMTSIIDVA